MVAFCEAVSVFLRLADSVSPSGDYRFRFTSSRSKLFPESILDFMLEQK